MSHLTKCCNDQQKQQQCTSSHNSPDIDIQSVSKSEKNTGLQQQVITVTSTESFITVINDLQFLQLLRLDSILSILFFSFQSPSVSLIHHYDQSHFEDFLSSSICLSMLAASDFSASNLGFFCCSTDWRRLCTSDYLLVEVSGHQDLQSASRGQTTSAQVEVNNLQRMFIRLHCAICIKLSSRHTQRHCPIIDFFYTFSLFMFHFQ